MAKPTDINSAKHAVGPPVDQREHEFGLVLSGISGLTPEIFDALFEAGCDDATPSIRSGRVFLKFARQAPSLKDAILSAIRDVRKANIGSHVMRVDETDLVTQADIARRIDRSRQLVNQYISAERGPGGFPPPAGELNDKRPLWSWYEVADWLYKHRVVQQDVLRDAQQKSVINSVLELEYLRQREPELTNEVLAAIGSK